MNKLHVKRWAHVVCAAALGLGLAMPAWADDTTNPATNTAKPADKVTTPALSPTEKIQQGMLSSLIGENLTLALQKNQNTATVLQVGDLLKLLRPVAPGLSVNASASEILGVQNGNRETFLGNLNLGYMHKGVRWQLGLHTHSTFYYDQIISDSVAPKQRTHITGKDFSFGLAVPVSGVLFSFQAALFKGKGTVQGAEVVGSQDSQTFYSLGTFPLEQKNVRYTLGLSKNFPLDFSQILTPYFVYQIEKNSLKETQETLKDSTNKVPLEVQFKKQTVTMRSAMLGLMYQINDAFTTPGLALGVDYGFSYRFTNKPKYEYTSPTIKTFKGGKFTNSDSGVSQRFGFQVGYQWGAVYMGAQTNIYYTFTPSSQPGVLNTQYSLQLSSAF